MKDFFNHLWLVNEADDSHLSLALGAGKRVSFVNFPDEISICCGKVVKDVLIQLGSASMKPLKEFLERNPNSAAAPQAKEMLEQLRHTYPRQAHLLDSPEGNAPPEQRFFSKDDIIQGAAFEEMRHQSLSVQGEIAQVVLKDILSDDRDQRIRGTELLGYNPYLIRFYKGYVSQFLEPVKSSDFSMSVPAKEN